MRTFGGTTAACLELGSLARSGGRYEGKLLAISHEGLTGYCSLNGYSICELAIVTQLTPRCVSRPRYHITIKSLAVLCDVERGGQASKWRLI
jgi:hypothetical protein